MYTIEEISTMKSLQKAEQQGISSDDESLSEHWAMPEIPTWKAVLASKSDLAVQDVCVKSCKQPVIWTFPYTLFEQQRHTVFSDLYFKRCCLHVHVRSSTVYSAFEESDTLCMCQDLLDAGIS